MAQNIHKVIIGGLEYKLTSDDETLLRKAVEIVNSEIEDLQKQSDVKLPVTQLYVLTALNLAEKLTMFRQKSTDDVNYFNNEISKLTKLIENSIVA